MYYYKKTITDNKVEIGYEPMQNFMWHLGGNYNRELENLNNSINTSGFLDLQQSSNFDFVAESESVSFNYVFASTEYSSFTCTSYNDIFGFFLSGPGITGPYSNNAVNLAYIPDPEGYTTYDDWLNNNNVCCK